MANKPIEFDPNQPFTVEGEAPEFDPEQPFTVGDPEPEQSIPTVATDRVFDDATRLAGGAPVTKPAPAPSTGNPLQDLAVDAATKFSENIEKQGGWGLSPETRQFLGADGPIKLLRPLTDVPANIADAAFRGYQALLAGTEMGAQELDAAARKTGLSDALSVGGNEFLPGSAVMAGIEAFPLAGAEVGGLRPAAPRRLTPEEEARYVDLLNRGTVSDIHEFIGERNLGFRPGEVEKYVEARDAGKPVKPEVIYENRPQIPEGEIKFDTNRPYTVEEGELADKLIADREAFEANRQPEPTAEEVFPKQKATPEEFEAGLQRDADAFLARKNEVEAGAVEESTRAVSDKVSEITSEWKNPPEFDVIGSLDDIKDPKIREQAELEGGRDALGFLGPDGRVRIIAGNVKDPSEIPAVVFHEGLGHHGLAQKFGSDLETMLQRFYDTNTGEFKAAVDKWIADNPDAYKGEKQTVRAAEEVLAEMSEGGKIPLLIKDRLTNYIKALSRKMGLKLSYSDREIKTILAMAHDAAVKGLPDARANGFRYMYIGASARGLQDVKTGLMKDNVHDFWDEVKKTIDDGTYDPVELRDKYGLHLGPENGTRAEISDHNARIRPEIDWDTVPSGERLPLSEVLDHPELFENYPELRDTIVTRQPAFADFDRAMQGWFDKGVLNVTPYAQDPLSTMLHEIQHWIQEKESWLPGGNMETVLKHMNPNQLMRLYNKAMKPLKEEAKRAYDRFDFVTSAMADDDVIRLLDDLEDVENELTDISRRKNQGEDVKILPVMDRRSAIEKAIRKKLFGKESYLELPYDDQLKYISLRQIINRGYETVYGALEYDFLRARDAVKKLETAENVEELAQALPADIKHEAYRNIFGEIEARDTQARRELTTDQRRAVLPYSNENGLPVNDIVTPSRGASSEASADVKLMRRRIQPSGEKIEKGMPNLNYVSTVNDIDDLVKELSAGYNGEVKTYADIKRESRDLNMTPGKVAKDKVGVGNLSAKLHAYGQAQADALENVAGLNKKLEEGYSPTVHAKYLKDISQLAAVFYRVQSDRSEVARALNALKILTQSNKKVAEIMQDLATRGGPISALADPESFMKFARSVQTMLDQGNPQGAANLITKVMKPYWEDYIITGRHAMMLSGLGTHYKNVVDNFGMIAREFEETVLAGAMKGFRGEITPQEVGARVYGLMRAALDGETYRKTAEAFMKGHGNRAVSSKVEIEGARIPGVSKILDALHAEDTFFRSFMDSTNLYALGMRKAKKEGFKGQALLEQGSHYAQNPTKEMLEEAREMADVALVVSKPSWFVQKIEAAKARKLEMDVGERVGRFVAHIVFPFARVTDRLLAQKLARSPLSFMDSKTRADFKAGGARRDVAIARTLYGTAIIGYMVWAANNDKTTGAGPEFKKKAALEAGGYMSNAVKTDDEYVDATALNVSANPFSLQNALAADVATLVKAYKGGEESGADYLSKIGRLAASFISTLGSSSFAENIAPYTDAYKDLTSGQGGAASAANIIGGLGTSFVPTAVRQANSAIVDPIRRDTTGDKSLTSRVKGRVESAIPGLSDDLPVKYDLYGRPMATGKNITGVNNRQKIDKDPTVREIQRLEQTTDKPVVTAPSPRFSIEGAEFKLTGEKYAEYQRIAGTLFLEAMKKVTPTKGWRSSDDDTKKAAIKDLLKETREAAREELIKNGVLGKEDIQNLDEVMAMREQ